MPEHVTREQISGLLEEPQGAPEVTAHLAECPDCSREYEQMSRMRMALSALPDLEPPPDEWDRIEAELGLAPAAGATRLWWVQRARWPLQAAAVLLLFAAGLMVGQRLAVESSGGDSQALSEVAPGSEGLAGLPGGTELRSEPAAAYLRSVADLQELRGSGMDQGAQGWIEDPAAVAERITHLDAIIDASREALETAPADPVLNNFLFDVMDEREQLAGRLDETLRLTGAEY
jgi:hypothetical protein